VAPSLYIDASVHYYAPSAARRLPAGTARAEMSFFFRMASRLRPSTPEEVVRSIKDSFLALHTRTHAKVIC